MFVETSNAHIKYSAIMIVRAMRDAAGRDSLYGEHVRSYKLLAAKWHADRWLRHSGHCAWCLEALGWEWFCSGAELAERCKDGEVDWGKIRYWLNDLLSEA